LWNCGAHTMYIYRCICIYLDILCENSMRVHRAAWLIRVTWRAYTSPYVWYDSLLCVTWCIHTCDMKLSYMWHMTHSYVWHVALRPICSCVTCHTLIHVTYDSLIRVTRHAETHLFVCDMSHTDMYGILHSYVWHVTRDDWPINVIWRALIHVVCHPKWWPFISSSR